MGDIIIRLEDIIHNYGPGMYCLTGGAGSGKSTLSSKLYASDISVYSLDWRLIGGSNYRKELLNKKQATSLSSYIDACNQFNWWDWNAIIADLEELANGNVLTIMDAYDRDTTFSKNVQVLPSKYILVEGAILGPVQLLSRYKNIFMMIVPFKTRLLRLLEKDCCRRDPLEILSRFLITEYSERKAYSELWEWFKHKILCVDSNGIILDKEFEPKYGNCSLPFYV